MSDEEDLVGNGKENYQSLKPQKNIIRTRIKLKDGDKEKPTDTYGLIEFKETTKRTRGKFVRLSDTTNPEDVYELMTKEWGVDKPRLLISVTGGAKSLNVDAGIKQSFKDGLLKVANTPGTWVTSGGTNTGVMKLVGDALHGSNNTCIGIVTWGVIAKREALVSNAEKPAGGTFPYHLGSYLLEDGVFLDYNHTHFLLVDDGSEGKYGREIQFRAKLEEYVMKSVAGSIPTVLLVMEGGPGTLNTVYAAATNDNIIPCVLVKGTGRTADLLVYAMENSDDIIENGVDNKYPELLEMIEKTFPEKDSEEFKNETYDKIMTLLFLEDCFTIADAGTEMDVDDAILTALLNDTDRKTSSYEQLKLTILWDRADLAESKILTPMQKWDKGKPAKELEWLMVIALAMNRIECVKLLLDYGISIKKLLTIEVLEFLYAYRSRDSTLKFEFHPIEYVCHNDGSDYAELFDELLSCASIDKKYCRLPMEIVQKTINRLCENLVRLHPNDILEVIDPPLPESTFENPFRELFYWAVLNNMLDMAKFLWEFEEEPMAKALIAAEIGRSLLARATLIDLQDGIKNSLNESLSTFQKLAYGLLDTCYKNNESMTEKCITCDLSSLPGATCLDLAISSSDREFVSHCSIQGILNDVWTGTINKTTEGRDILMAFFCPLLLSNMDIRNIDRMSDMINVDRDGVGEDQQTEDIPEVSSMINGEKLTYGTFNYNNLSAEDFQYFDDGGETKRRPKLPLYKKMYLFYFYSPMVKFYTHAAGYILFMMLFAYIAMLEKTSPTPDVLEYILVATVAGFIVGEIYQVLHLDAPNLKIRLKEYMSDFWNLFDVICVLLFVVAITLRSVKETTHVGHVFYAIDCSLWIIRWLQVLYVHPVSGPYVVMIGDMFRDMMYFLIILFVFLVAHGVAMTAILIPGPPSMQMLVYSLFHPYFNIYGELFIDRDAENDATTRFGTPKTNAYSEPIAWIYLGMYLLIGNVLLLNLLIAIFGNTYEKVINNAAQIWKFGRYGLVLEYTQQRIALFPPFSLIGHIYLALKWVFCKLCCKNIKYDAGLKSDLSLEDKERLREFESNCLTNLMRDQTVIEAGQQAEEDS